MTDKILELIYNYNRYIDMLQADILLYERDHGNDKGHDNIYTDEVAVIEKIDELEEYFEGIL